MTDHPMPFHSGELDAQRRAGAGDVAARVAGAIRPFLPEQHRMFHTSLPFVVVSAADVMGRPWVTLLEGPAGFITSPDPKTLAFQTELDAADPLAAAFTAGTDVGLLGIELATRRRNRLSGRITKSDFGYTVAVNQTFGNCPRFIHPRTWRWADPAPAGPTNSTQSLSQRQMQQITAADTLFVGSGQRDDEDLASNGYDASHRGGAPGFVDVMDSKRLRIPDYAGNNFFNTIGNLLKNPMVALLFIEFETGTLLHITGQAEINWSPADAEQTGAKRMIEVTIDQVIERPKATKLRWTPSEQQPRSSRF